MDYSFVIIDDDVACRRMLSRIIEKENLGEVVAEFCDGRGDITNQIMHEIPDIILIDLLMPGEDGIEISKKLRERNYQGKIVMISQVENKEMVAQAYSAGVEFYITKPINRVEVLSVLGKVMERIEMQRSFVKVRSSLEALNNINNLSQSFSSKKHKSSPSPQQENDDTIRDRTMEILSDLGIIGEPGSHDLVQIMIFLSTVSDTEKYLGQFRHLKDLYLAVQKKYLKGDYTESIDIRTIEQRIRRAVKHAMENLAALGLEDYYNPYFERYSSKFFEFNELRQKMRELKEAKKEASRTRVNIKQFINALYMEIQSNKNN